MAFRVAADSSSLHGTAKSRPVIDRTRDIERCVDGTPSHMAEAARRDATARRDVCPPDRQERDFDD